MQQADVNRHPDGPGPRDLLQAEAARPEGEKDEGKNHWLLETFTFSLFPFPFSLLNGAQPAGDQQSRADHRCQGDAVDAQHRRIARERTRGNLRIPQREPGKAGEYPAARPFRQHPGRRRERTPPDGIRHFEPGARIAH
ncbi:hypothetical protein D3C83_07990 [compost metagenome]